MRSKGPADDLPIEWSQGTLHLGVDAETGQVRIVLENARPGLNLAFDMEPEQALRMATLIFQSRYAARRLDDG